jgi:ribonuclease P/MRP protein subunit POP5
MVRFKNRWVLFQIVQDPVIDNGKVTYPKTQFEVTDSMISKSIFQAIELNYGHFGKGQGSVAGILEKKKNPLERSRS